MLTGADALTFLSFSVAVMAQLLPAGKTPTPRVPRGTSRSASRAACCQRPVGSVVPATLKRNSAEHRSLQRETGEGDPGWGGLGWGALFYHNCLEFIFISAAAGLFLVMTMTKPNCLTVDELIIRVT